VSEAISLLVVRPARLNNSMAHSSDRSMGEIAETLQAITKKHGGVEFEFAKSDAEAEAAWQGRKAALWSVQALKENGRVWTTDVW
jgi:D-lactate dehydrogenase (cytochrome)